MGLVWLLVVAVLILAAAALVKYLRSGSSQARSAPRLEAMQTLALSKAAIAPLAERTAAFSVASLQCCRSANGQKRSRQISAIIGSWPQ
jgi:hypothetical protein